MMQNIELMSQELQLAEYLNARLCHDLAGNIGAASNGTEFLLEASDEIREKAAYLLRESTTRLLHILEFYRFSFVPVTQNLEADLEKLREVCNGYITNSRVSFHFADEYLYIKDATICMHHAKVICCLAAIAGNTLVHGGEVRVTVSAIGAGKYVTKIHGSSQLVRMADVIQEVLFASDISKIVPSSKNIFAYYAVLAARAIDKRIELNLQQDSLELTII